MNQIQLEDCQNIGNLDFIEWKQFENSTILITGSTGLIGQNLVNAIAYNSQRKGLGIKLILPVRNTEAVIRCLDGLRQKSCIMNWEQNLK